VVRLTPKLTASCGLSGQLADGITTPIVGLLSDKTKTRCGKRMPWYYAGSLLVIPTFLGIFSYPMFINDLPLDDHKRTAWYVTLPAIFNVGWAST